MPPVFALTLALAATSALAAAPAHAAQGDLELTLASEGVAFVSDTLAATATDSVGFTPGLRLGYGVTERITAFIGWRDLVAMNRDDRGYALETSGDALVVGARYGLGLHPMFDLAFELDLEAMHSDFDLTLAGQRGTTSAWSFGVIPKLVLSMRTDIELFFIDIRLFAGFAARTNLRADALRLKSEVPARQVAPLDLGSLNLSGFVFGLNLALVF